MSSSPRMLVHRGHVEACGLCFEAPWLDQAELRGRILAHCSGATVLEFDDAYVVVFAGPRRIDTEQCEATPLVAEHGSMIALPLRAAELAALRLTAPTLVRVRNAQVELTPLSAGRTVDLAQWLDLEGWVQVDVTSLGTPPVAARPALHPADVIVDDARAILGAAVPRVAPQRQAMLDALAAKGAAGGGERRDANPGWLGGVGRWFSAVFRTPQHPALTGGVVMGATPRAAVPAEPGALRRWLDRMILRSSLAELIGRRQAAYLGKTLRMFETGDFEEALRHAVPLSALPGATKPPSLSMPSRRDELTLGGPHHRPVRRFTSATRVWRTCERSTATLRASWSCAACSSGRRMCCSSCWATTMPGSRCSSVTPSTSSRRSWPRAVRWRRAP